jgi:hypothetical protein
MGYKEHKRKSASTADDDSPKKKKHQSVVEDSTKCCGKKFSGRSEKQEHILKTESCDRTCFLCLKTYSSKQNLDQHFQRVSDAFCLEWNFF